MGRSKLPNVEVGDLIRIRRRWREDINGVVLANTEERLALAALVDGARTQGVSVVRWQDVKRVQNPAPYDAFVRAALRRMRVRLPRLAFDESALESWRALLEAASHAYPLVTVHTEEQDASVCFIGAIENITSRSVALRLISPGAVWDARDAPPKRIPLRELTLVELDTPYERALYAVGGPAKNPRRGFVLTSPRTPARS